MILNNFIHLKNPDHNKRLSGLVQEAAYVTEMAAIACHEHIGKGDEKQADQAAVNAMRDALNSISISGKIVIGEGERDEAPMLYIGEEVGCGDGINVDIAVDPLEGTTLCAHAAANSIAVMAIGEHKTLLNAPDVYMDKIAIGGKIPDDLVSLDESPEHNLREIAKAKKISVSDLNVMILSRPRHQDLIAQVRSAGARIQLITDGDITAAINTTDHRTGVDVYMGIGGAPEGVLAAAALKVCGGYFQGKLIFSSDAQKERAKNMGINDFNKLYNIDSMVSGDVIFAATGVTDGNLLKGVKKRGFGYSTNTLIMHHATRTIRVISSEFLNSTK